MIAAGASRRSACARSEQSRSEDSPRGANCDKLAFISDSVRSAIERHQERSARHHSRSSQGVRDGGGGAIPKAHRALGTQIVGRDPNRQEE